MTVTALPGASSRPVITSPDQLGELLGIPFSEQQLAAITAPLEPGVIIAGAGSGKTTVMAARVVWLVGTGQVRPEQVLGLTFTRKAAAELSQRVRSALDRAGVVDTRDVDEAGEQLIMTYDAFAARIVADHGLRIGVDSDARMVTGATRFRLAASVVARAAGPFDQLQRLRPRSITERVLRLDSELQQHLIGASQLDRHAALFGRELAAAPLSTRGQVYADIRGAQQVLAERLELVGLAEAYADEKRRRGVVEFADQMAIAAQLASQVPEVSATLRAAYAVVLLDEYQDTSSAQAAMLQGLFSGEAQATGRGHPVTAVGDPFQAIYGWRGAAASNITQFATDFPRHTGEPAIPYELTVNRRSGRTILDVANVLAAPLRRQQGSDSVLVAPEGTVAGEVHGATFETWPEEVTWVCDRIVALGPGSGRRRWSDIAVLTRRNADIAEIFAQLSARDVPAEIVGLGGLLSLPEIQDVVATLRLTDDVTANPEVVRLLSGPRWAVGPTDLAVLGRRARDLAADPGRDQPAPTADPELDPLLDGLSGAVAEVDPTDLVCLLDAVEDPGEGPYSPRAREVFTAFGREIAELRRHAAEPVLDLVRRVITTLGVDIELAATPEYHRTRRGEQLATFLDAVASYVDVDADASLSGMLAWLQAEVESGVGLERAVPTDDDAVKLLTIHKAKGLEWDVVLLPALVDGTFPSDRITDNWVTNPAVVPSPLRGDASAIPQVGHPVSVSALKDYKEALRVEHRRSEDRLAYVAVTRARRQLYASGHRWRAEVQRPRTFSEYLVTLLAEADAQGRMAARVRDDPAPQNPLVAETAAVAWPQPWDPDAWERRQEAAAAVRAARGRPATEEPELLLDDWETLAGWDLDLDRLLAEARRSRRRQWEVGLPAVMSATAWLRAVEDPQGFAEDLLRPMPRQPSRAARFGTRFHRWVEQHLGGAPALLDPTEPESAEDSDWDDGDLSSLCEAFARGRFGERQPYRLEAPVELRLAGRTLRGRIDAIYREPDGGWLVVDWKTSGQTAADPLQLAIYRLAWAEVQGVAPETVRAGFHYVRRDEFVELTDLPDADGLAARLAGAGGDPVEAAPS